MRVSLIWGHNNAGDHERIRKSPAAPNGLIDHWVPNDYPQYAAKTVSKKEEISQMRLSVSISKGTISLMTASVRNAFAGGLAARVVRIHKNIEKTY